RLARAQKTPRWAGPAQKKAPGARPKGPRPRRGRGFGLWGRGAPPRARPWEGEGVTEDLLALAQRRLYPNYRPAPFVFRRGRGCELFDTEGRRYLDMAAGVAVCALGHAHPRYVAALSEQLGRLGHVSNYFYNEPNVRLADELCRRTGFDRAFFCNSGAEAN